MRPLMRWMARIAAALSFLLFIAAVSLWVRSYFVADNVSRCLCARASVLISYRCQEFISARGSLVFQEEYFQYPIVYDRIGLSPYSLRRISTSNFSQVLIPSYSSCKWDFWCCGLGLANMNYTGIIPTDFEHVHVAVIPIPALPLIAAVAPSLIALHEIRRRRAMQGGRCLQCGYDLRATPFRCPECGTVVETSTSPIVRA